MHLEQNKEIYDGPEGPLSSPMVSSEFDIVLGSFKQFSEVINSSLKSQTVFGSLKQLSEVLNSSRKSQAVLGASNSSHQSQIVLALLNNFCFLAILFVISCYFHWLLLIVIKVASKAGLICNMEFLQWMDGPEDGCQQLNLLGSCFRKNKILSYHIIHNTTMVKQDSVVKLSNLVVPSARKESKAAVGYLKSYNRVMPTAWKWMCFLTKGAKEAGLKVVSFERKERSSRPS